MLLLLLVMLFLGPLYHIAAKLTGGTANTLISAVVGIKDFGYLMELNDGVRFTMWQSKPIDGNPCISNAAMK